MRKFRFSSTLTVPVLFWDVKESPLLFLIYKVGWKYTQDKNYTILAAVLRKWPPCCESEAILSKTFSPC